MLYESSKMPGNFIEITKSEPDYYYDKENEVSIMDHVLEKDELDSLLRALNIVEPDESDKEEAYHYYKVTAEELLEALHYLCKLYCVDRETWIRKLGRTTMFIDLLFDHTPQEIMKIYDDFIKEDNINEEES